MLLFTPKLDNDLRAGGLLLSFALSSDVSFLSPPLLLVKSKEPPGVLGVLPVAPKLANAPLPSPKADEAPVPVGDATEDVVMGPTELNGLFFPWLLKLPNLLEGVSWLSFRSFLLTESESLLLLLLACSVSGVSMRLRGR